MTRDEIQKAFDDGANHRDRAPLTASEIAGSFHTTARAWEKFFNLPTKSLRETEQGLVYANTFPLPVFVWRDDDLALGRWEDLVC